MADFKTDPEDEEVVNIVNLCKAFNRETHTMLETLQIAQYTRGGPLVHADLEGTIREFLQCMARQLA